MNEVIKIDTQSTRRRYIDILQPGSRPRANVFVSHSWHDRFISLVRAIELLSKDHPNGKNMVVWLDIFAVRQWPGNDADIEFRNVVKDTDTFFLSYRYPHTWINQPPATNWAL